MSFDWSQTSPEDRWLARAFGVTDRPPDLTIAPDGEPYLYRWHLVPRNHRGNIYFHVQVASDPERPLHDHPWDNTSTILSGEYIELLSETPRAEGSARKFVRTTGDVVYRKAGWAHRLILPPRVPYTMTLFTTGPRIKTWGFWLGDQWVPHMELIYDTADGRSVFLIPERYRDDN